MTLDPTLGGIAPLWRVTRVLPQGYGFAHGPVTGLRAYIPPEVVEEYDLTHKSRGRPFRAFTSMPALDKGEMRTAPQIVAPIWWVPDLMDGFHDLTLLEHIANAQAHLEKLQLLLANAAP